MKRRIELIKHHIHAGLPHRPGEVVDLDTDLADWLISEGAARAVAPEAPTPPHPHTHSHRSTPSKGQPA